MNSEYYMIWKKHRREKAGKIALVFDRFTIDGKPTCIAWYGAGGQQKMVCFFLESYNFGLRYRCRYRDEIIQPNENETLAPIAGCPLWRSR